MGEWMSKRTSNACISNKIQIEAYWHVTSHQEAAEQHRRTRLPKNAATKGSWDNSKGDEAPQLLMHVTSTRVAISRLWHEPVRKQMSRKIECQDKLVHSFWTLLCTGSDKESCCFEHSQAGVCDTRHNVCHSCGMPGLCLSRNSGYMQVQVNMRDIR